MATKLINGKEYDLDKTNWQDEINKAAASGDYKLAAQYEQARNEKINSSNYTGAQKTTSNYAGWLDTTDYAQKGIDQMLTGASWEDVYDTYKSRENKTNGTIGMEKYVNDQHQQDMLDYILANRDKVNISMPTFDYGTVSNAPYSSNYKTKIDEMLNNILNREDFSYDAATDPLYQQYKTQYNREGTRAMNDTLASAAADAGGMNSYAITAAQQANNYYATQLGDKIPELYQLAYEMYLQDIDNQVRDLGLLQDMDDTQYNRYRDTLDDWRADRDFAYGKYRDDMSDYKWGTEFDYGVDLNNLQTEYQKELDAQEQANWEKEFGLADRSMTLDESAFEHQVDMDEQDQENWDKTFDWETSNSGNTGSTSGDKTTGTNTDKDKDTNKGSGWDNGGLSADQIREMQNFYEVEADGRWGKQSTQAAGGMDAKTAWEEYQRLTGGGGDKVTFQTQDDAIRYMKNAGVPSGDLIGLMSEYEWTQRKGSLGAYGQGGTSVNAYDSYAEYATAYVQYAMEKNKK